ncbi:MAG: ring-cleaving dioxygenase [Candidatus Buchananbacteria bacterium]|nr:ring-cleaving dioxygenase [Candidatus Buchananbacteria bacterium]
MQLLGLHHVTAVTGQIKKNLSFYTEVLGLRLVKKTVNQDDVTAYHLFYADAKGTPGTDMTFFDWPQAGPNSETNDGIIRTMFRVASKEALNFWIERLEKYSVEHFGIHQLGSREALFFLDPEGQKLALVNDNGLPFAGTPWTKTDVPAEHALRGFYAVQLATPSLTDLEPVLTQLLNFKKEDSYPSLDRAEESVVVFSLDGGGPGKEVHVVERRGNFGLVGAGGVHHVAFRIGDEQNQKQWLQRLSEFRWSNSGVVDRFYFKSVYFRISYGILFELATDEPGFSADESVEKLGETLALPPFLEPRRNQIEAGLKPL